MRDGRRQAWQRVRWVVLCATGAAAGALGCSNGGGTHDAASTRDASADARDGGSGTRTDGAREDAARDASRPDGGGCATSSPVDALAPSTICAAATVTFDPATLCSGAAECPVTTFAHLTAAGGLSDYPTIAPVGTDGASVLLQSTSGGWFSCLYTIAAGETPVAEEVPPLGTLAALTGAGGPRTIVMGLGNGLQYLEEAGAGWDRDTIPGFSDLIYPSAARATASGDLHVTYFDNETEQGQLASRHAGCWRIAPLPGPTTYFYSIDVGTDGPWVAGMYTDPNTFTTTLEVVGPDGTAYRPTPTVRGIEASQQPIVIAGGLSGTARYPALITQDSYGVHVLEAEGATATWTDQIVPGSAAAVVTTNCPPEQLETPDGGCGAISTTCTAALDGPVSGYAAARTASGKTFVAWAEEKNGLGNQSVTCTSAAQGALCECTTMGISSQGSGALVIARVDTASPGEVLRLSYATPIPTAAYDLAMIARGDTLVLAANQGFGNGGDTDLLYFEIDTAGL